MSEKLTIPQDEALAYLYGGGDEEIVCWSARWVVTRFPQKCVSVMHEGKMTQPAGARMILERARVEGQFGSCYTCKDCIEKAQKELRNR